MAITLNGTSGVTSPTYGGTVTAEYSVPVTAFKNRIINGDMRIDQRNAGASQGTTTLYANYTLDRWQAQYSVVSKFTTQQNAGAVTPPVGFTNYLGCTSSSAYTVGASEAFGVAQYIEGLNCADLAWGTANAQTVTLSFRVYSSLTGTFGGALRNSAGNRSYPFSYSIPVANTWTTISLTIAGDTTGTWLTTNGVGIQVFFNLGSGSSISGTANTWAGAGLTAPTGATSVVGTNGATFYITGVQLEKGSTATSFDYRPYGTELALCQRYYQNVKAQIGCAATTTSINGAGALPVTMRDEPSIGKTSGTFAFGDMVSVLYTSTSTPTLSTSNNYRSINFLLGGFTGLTQYRSYRHEPDATYVALFTVSAEL